MRIYIQCRNLIPVPQTGSGGDSLVLAVNEEGTLVLTLTQHAQAQNITLGRRLNDNAWHRVYLK